MPLLALGGVRFGATASGPPPAADEMEIAFSVTTATVSSVTSIPNGSDILRAYVHVLSAYSGGATLTIGRTGSATLISDGTDINLQQTGTYDLPGACGVAWGAAAVVLATIAGSPSTGSAKIYIVYNTSPGT